MEKYLAAVARARQTRLLIACDEYEALQGKGFGEQPEKAEQLLAAIRSYTQHQKQVIFLFAGAHYFNELRAPDWGKYFVHSQPLIVHYLSREKTLQLTHPTEDFPVRYEDDVPEEIYRLTRGHPALAQEICYHLVEIANMENRSALNGEDLQRVLREKILRRDNHPMSRFWEDFCAAPEYKEVVRQVIRGERPTHAAALGKLLDHRFVVEEGAGYRLCCPLFEQYVRMFDPDFFGESG